MFSTPAALRGFSQENSDIVARKPGVTSSSVVRKPFGDRTVNGGTPASTMKSAQKKVLKKEAPPLFTEDKDEELTIYDCFYYKPLQDHFEESIDKKHVLNVLESYCGFRGRQTPEPLLDDIDVEEIHLNDNYHAFQDGVNSVELFNGSTETVEDVSLPELDFDL